ncbi:hypothetical protein ABKA04_000983 [Annulohypoxylon sp. FPYF3050]
MSAKDCAAERLAHHHTIPGYLTIAPQCTNDMKRKACDDLEDMEIDMTCDEIRDAINKILDNNVMRKCDFYRAIGCSRKIVERFLSKSGPTEGQNSLCYRATWEWLERQKLEIPDVGKRQKTDAAATAISIPAISPSISPSISPTISSTIIHATIPATIPAVMPAVMPAVTPAITPATTPVITRASISPAITPATSPASTCTSSSRSASPEVVDFRTIHLPGEETEEVPVYDTCDEIRNKITKHLETTGDTKEKFCCDISVRWLGRPFKGFPLNQLNEFRRKYGANAGCTSKIFYAAYVFFEKKRIAEGKPKSEHRLNMERVWARNGGFDLKHDEQCP